MLSHYPLSFMFHTYQIPALKFHGFSCFSGLLLMSKFELQFAWRGIADILLIFNKCGMEIFLHSDILQLEHCYCHQSYYASHPLPPLCFYTSFLHGVVTQIKQMPLYQHFLFQLWMKNVKEILGALLEWDPALSMVGLG